MVTSTIFRIWTSQLQSPKKVPAITMAIPSCLFVSFSPSQPHLLPTFPKLSTSPLSHLSQLPNLTNFPPFRPSQPHTLLPFLPSQPHPPSHLKLKHSKMITLGLLSLHWFLREGSQSKILILLSQETISGHWI